MERHETLGRTFYPYYYRELENPGNNLTYLLTYVPFVNLVTFSLFALSHTIIIIMTNRHTFTFVMFIPISDNTSRRVRGAERDEREVSIGVNNVEIKEIKSSTDTHMNIIFIYMNITFIYMNIMFI